MGLSFHYLREELSFFLDWPFQYLNCLLFENCCFMHLKDLIKDYYFPNIQNFDFTIMIDIDYFIKIVAINYFITNQNFVKRLLELEIWNCFIAKYFVAIAIIIAVVKVVELSLNFRIFFNLIDLFYYHLVDYYWMPKHSNFNFLIVKHCCLNFVVAIAL